MRSAKDLQGLAVVGINDGKKLGTADELIVSPDELRLLGLVIKSGGPLSRDEQIVEARDIRSIGSDAITVDAEAVAHGTEAIAESIRETRAGNRRIVGSKVVTESGTLLGTASDFAIDESTHRITSLTLSSSLFQTGDTLAVDRVISVGPDVVVVRDGNAGADVA